MPAGHEESAFVHQSGANAQIFHCAQNDSKTRQFLRSKGSREYTSDGIVIFAGDAYQTRAERKTYPARYGVLEIVKSYQRAVGPRPQFSNHGLGFDSLFSERRDKPHKKYRDT